MPTLNNAWTMIPSPTWAVTDNATDMCETLNGEPMVEFLGITHGDPDHYAAAVEQPFTRHGAKTHPRVTVWARGNWLMDFSDVRELRYLSSVLALAARDLENLSAQEVAA